VEQLDVAKGKYPEIAGRPLIVVSSAQSGPLLQSYVSSGQVDIMVNGLYDAARYEYVNNTRPGTVRSYWDAFGVGLMMAVIAIVLGSVWSVLMRIRERRAEAEQG
jgi:cytochrome bd-type quinol oxidase subunit 1